MNQLTHPSCCRVARTASLFNHTLCLLCMQVRWPFFYDVLLDINQIPQLVRELQLRPWPMLQLLSFTAKPNSSHGGSSSSNIQAWSAEVASGRFCERPSKRQMENINLFAVKSCFVSRCFVGLRWLHLRLSSSSPGICQFCTSIQPCPISGGRLPQTKTRLQAKWRTLFSEFLKKRLISQEKVREKVLWIQGHGVGPLSDFQLQRNNPNVDSKAMAENKLVPFFWLHGHSGPLIIYTFSYRREIETTTYLRVVVSFLPLPAV